MGVRWVSDECPTGVRLLSEQYRVGVRWVSDGSALQVTRILTQGGAAVGVLLQQVQSCEHGCTCGEHWLKDVPEGLGLGSSGYMCKLQRGLRVNGPAEGHTCTQVLHEGAHLLPLLDVLTRPLLLTTPLLPSQSIN